MLLPRPSLFRALVIAVTATAASWLQAVDLSALRPIGDVQTVARQERGLTLTCADGATVQLLVLAPDLVRVRTRFAGQPAGPDHSWAIARTDWPVVPWQVRETPESVTLTTAELVVEVRRSPLLVTFRDPAGRTINADERPMGRDAATGRVGAAKRLGLDEHFYGLGEKAARLDRRRSEFVMWNSDTPGYVEGTDPIYQSIPFYVGLEDGRAYGLFYDNSHRTVFDLGRTTQEYAGFAADGGEIDYYFFQGPGLKKILGRYTELTGRMPLPPRWALGHQQSRYSYYPAAMVEEIVAQYRRRDLPLDVVYLDIHYMDGYRVFTWDPKRFPDPAGMSARLAKQGVKVVTIVDPGVKYQPEGGYAVFDEGMAKDFFLRRTDGRPYIGEVWPGKAVFVDYTREDARRWWGDLHRKLLDGGVAGIWTDMNEPSDFLDKTGETQRDVVFDDRGARTLYGKNRNTFALNMARATYEGLQRLRPNDRPFVITRAGYAGVQRYSTVWTGDNNATFESLALNIPMFASLGLSGQAFVGSDVPGFIGRGDGELLARSYQLASLVPLCRNHGAIDNYDHEPWRYGAPYEAIVREYLKLRYRLMPYLYTTLEEAHRTGVPWFRPLLLEFQDDPSTLNLDDSFMVGPALLAAPVVRAGERAKDVYLPRGRWYDFWTGESVEGGELRRCDAPLSRMPLFVRGGSVLVTTEPMAYVAEKPWDPVRFEIYPDAAGAAAGSLYEDDGQTPAYLQGAWRRTAVSCVRSGAELRVRLAAPEGPFVPAPRKFEVVVRNAGPANTVILDGQTLPATTTEDLPNRWKHDAAGVVTVILPDDSRPHEIVIR
ncbi:TIM-barrel domain-containing protein [Opitutus sp. ER46]|uniref:glycoside hydrolase family 31 protein n=1 Tax=Opitutus sp. ER46 TaxID=2161864 RepID=UPI000D2F5EFF|nr:TIM-barrel domain-containing protein [Opitutus sp. ER46]PTX91008.1 alpha-glucosidase [Opitutus sp. ER46]